MTLHVYSPLCLLLSVCLCLSLSLSPPSLSPSLPPFPQVKSVPVSLHSLTDCAAFPREGTRGLRLHIIRNTCCLGVAWSTDLLMSMMMKQMVSKRERGREGESTCTCTCSYCINVHNISSFYDSQFILIVYSTCTVSIHYTSLQNNTTVHVQVQCNVISSLKWLKLMIQTTSPHNTTCQSKRTLHYDLLQSLTSGPGLTFISTLVSRLTLLDLLACSCANFVFL